MKVLIPMAGLGKRFRSSGYTTPKPLIEVDNIPMIEHIVGNFSTEDSFVFGINEEHFAITEVHNVLDRIAPNAVKICMPYQSEGPVASVQHLLCAVADDEPVIVNYCDFSWVWDYDQFKKMADETSCDGAVICYHGFHPHLLGDSSYATVDTDGQWMRALREKHSWHDSKFDDWTSSGTYYFKSGKLLKDCCEKIAEKDDWRINGEHYVSQLFRVMEEDQKRVAVFEIPFMLQWGTPEDLDDYRYWSDYFRAKMQRPTKRPSTEMNVLTLMAGAGSRFAEAGYTTVKPFITVDGSFMVANAVNELPHGSNYLFISQQDFSKKYATEESKLLKLFDSASYIHTQGLTEGQACTALLAKDKLENELPLLIAACDHSTILDDQKFKDTIELQTDIDALIFTYRHNPAVRHNPKMYGWVSVDAEGQASNVSVKLPLSDAPMEDHAIIGAFWFRTANLFSTHAEKMIAENNRINNEFYIDQCMNYLIQSGCKVCVFEVDKYASWGTPNDLQTYKYWQAFFNQAEFHPYKAEYLAKDLTERLPDGQ